MKKLFMVSLTMVMLSLGSCGSGSDSKQKTNDTVSTGASSIDSAANNGILPPSAAPGNAGNSSLADTTYKDTTKTKK